ncbi:MAG: DUF2147 domain-containing protein [Thermodesulfovibrionales bacterium]|jgi:uncharacterized protein (DUF2147 family)
MFIVFASIMLATAFAFAAGPDDILGLWNTEKRDAKIAIYKCGTKYCGNIAWLKEATYPAGSKEGVPGTPVLDHNNPNPELREKPLIGSPILIDFVFAGDNLWKNGKIYDSDNGKIYNGKMTLVSPDQLNVRGFIGISIIGGTTTWSRAIAGME